MIEGERNGGEKRHSVKPTPPSRIRQTLHTPTKIDALGGANTTARCHWRETHKRDDDQPRGPLTRTTSRDHRKTEEEQRSKRSADPQAPNPHLEATPCSLTPHHTGDELRGFVQRLTRHQNSKRHARDRENPSVRDPSTESEQRHGGGRDRPQASPEPPYTRRICNRNRRI
ncbi:hypothetical protein Bca4012_090046 [Brassica carinata]